MSKRKTARIDWHAPGMRRVKLLMWALFNKTPLEQPIDEEAERAAAKRVKMRWEKYLELKTAHPEVWAHYAARRKRAQIEGGYKPMPLQFFRQRYVTAPQQARMKRRGNSIEYLEWLYREYSRYMRLKPGWRKNKVANELMGKIVGL